MKLWKFISNIGAVSTDTSDALRRIHLVNQISFLTITTTFFFAFHMIVIGMNYYIPIQFAVGIVCSLNFYFCFKRKYTLAVYWLYGLIGANIFYCSIENPGAGVEYFLIPLGMLPLTVIENKKICVVLNVIAAFAFLASWYLNGKYVGHEKVDTFYTQLTFLMTVASVFALCAVILYQFRIVNYRYANIISEQKEMLEEKKRDITDSINYAKRIQEAKLSGKDEIQKVLPLSFILFKPKDIVSGDFYFFQAQDKSVIVAAADCTGHGVPGAFMSMIGIERLEDAVLKNNNPTHILSHLNRGVKSSLKQSEVDGSTRDGMDVALCNIDVLGKRLKYAGANRPLWIIRKNAEQLEEIKATKTAIGGLTPNDQTFEEHEVQLNLGDRIYLFSDGYADQFSGQNKKLTTKKFKELLLSLKEVPMEEQEIKLEQFITNWCAGVEQIDDILVIGIEV